MNASQDGDAVQLTIFFPCYNDAGTVASMVAVSDETAKKLTDRYEIIVIDDGSTDPSREILRSLEPKYANLKVIYHEQNRGYGGALRSGFGAARGEWVFYTDGDGQYDVADLAWWGGVPAVGGRVAAASGGQAATPPTGGTPVAGTSVARWLAGSVDATPDISIVGGVPHESASPSGGSGSGPLFIFQ